MRSREAVIAKRSSGAFKRRKQDFYVTPVQAVAPLLRHLPRGASFVEPCAGAGHLVGHLEAAGLRCIAAFDINPQPPVYDVTIGQRDACGDWVPDAAGMADAFITNPPWSRPILHKIIVHLAATLPTWLLLDADWCFTAQATPLLPLLRKIVTVGRLKWIPDSEHQGKDNVVWYLFDKPRPPGKAIEFHGRMIR